MVDGFDVSKFTLGTLCGNGCQYQDSGQSLRYLKGNQSCVECARRRATARQAELTRNSKTNRMIAECKAKGFVNLNELSEGMCVNKRPSVWVRKESAQRLIAQCREKYGIEPIETFTGRLFGTWAHPDIAKAFQQWLSVNPVDFEFNPELHELGKLCRNRHDWRETGQTLRYRRNGVCVACSSKKREEYRGSEHGKKQRKQYDRLYRLTPQRKVYNARYRKSESRRAVMRRYNQSEKGRAASRRATAKRMQTPEGRARAIRFWNESKKKRQTPEGRILDRLKAKEYAIKNPERVKLTSKLWRQSDRGRAVKRRNEQIREGRRRANHFAKYTRTELEVHLQRFGDRCAYCQINPAESIDHFISLARGGSDCIGNLVSACLRCNHSKSSKDPYEWYSEQPFYSEKQWRKILKLLGKSEDGYNQIPLL